MQVKTYLNISKIPNAGIGLFAAEFIPKGTIVWKMDSMNNSYKEEEFKSMPNLYKEFINTYSFKYNNQYILCVDNARFFNHSNTPNCGSIGDNCTMAQVDINIGDELTDNYFDFGIIEEDNEFNSKI